jgi:hypothetical protein
MQTRSVLIAILALAILTGCTTTATLASLGTAAVTGRSPGEWTATWATGGDCSSLNLVNDKYLCEMPVTYNRHGLE